jgi:hypothetical protein
MDRSIMTAESARTIDALPAGTREVAAAIVATAQQGYTAPIHVLLKTYHSGSMPVTAAKRVYDHIHREQLSGREVKDIIQKLVYDDDHACRVIVGASALGGSTAYVMDGGELVAITRPGQANPWLLLAQGADAITTGYDSLTDVEKALMAPGIIACRGRQLPDNTKYDETLVWSVSKSLRPDGAYESGVRCLVPPHYRVIQTDTALPAGMPIRTGRVCNVGVPRSKTIKVVSAHDGVEKLRNVLWDDEPERIYCAAGKALLLLHVYETMQVITAALGNGHDNAAAAALHSVIQDNARAIAAIPAAIPRMSHHE